MDVTVIFSSGNVFLNRFQIAEGLTSYLAPSGGGPIQADDPRLTIEVCDAYVRVLDIDDDEEMNFCMADFIKEFGFIEEEVRV